MVSAASEWFHFLYIRPKYTRDTDTPALTHPLTDAQRCEVQQRAGGVAFDACNTQEGRVDGSQLVLVVVQSAPAARGLRGV